MKNYSQFYSVATRICLVISFRVFLLKSRSYLRESDVIKSTRRLNLVKSGVRKLLITTFALLTAAFLGLSVLFSKPLEFSRTADAGMSGSSSQVINATDSLADKLDTSEFMDSDLLSSSAARVNSDGTRRIIVEMESDSMLDVYLGNDLVQKRYGDFTSYVNASEGRKYSTTLTAEQSDFISALNNTTIDYELRHSYTSIINGISLVVDDDDVSAISNMDGVKSVIYSESYDVPAAEATINEVSVYSTGIYDSSDIAEEYGYTGEGLAVAVLDTGFDRSHSAFQEMPPEDTLAIMQSDVREKFNNLTAVTYGQSITLNDVYYNTKVPFAYDYADGDPDVFPKSSSHGLHVAGVIAGHEEGLTAADGEAFENNSTFSGVAPDAQLVICKVFPDQEDGLQGGAETDDILAALSDCIALGVDVINMSLGTAAGFSREEDGNAINEVYDKVYAAGINLVVAASNDGSSAQNGAYGSTNLTSNPDSGTVGSPSTYAGALSVASISGQLSSYLELSDGTAIYFNESSNASGEQGDFVAEILAEVGAEQSATVNFVVIPGYGYDYNYTTAIRNQLADGNTIAVVSRGETNFEEKQRVAASYGAIGCIIYNNVSGHISASLGTGKEIPTCTVTAEVGQSLVSMGSGTITINSENKAGPFMSQFSSWGPTPDLKIKPEITAHGGEITSSVVGGYSIYSGTSMASPNMAGAVALLRQHVSENYELTGTELSDRVNQLLMSTATIVRDERGLPYAVRRQGAGLGDISKAIATDAYLYVENNSKPKLELGDDPDRTGVYTMEFHVQNMSSNVKTYNLGAIIMTESVSIDGITVAEQAYMLDDAKKTYYIDGVRSDSGVVTLAANEDVTISVTIQLTAAQKDYLDENFENGMYVEGYITLEDADSEGVDLSIPYLAFYGDWLDAPIFDHTTYEVSSDYYNTAIEDEDKTVAAVYESVVIGRYYRGTETYIPLGQYVYDTEGGADSGIESMVDKIAVGNSDYGVYEFYAVYFGMLRAVEEMEVVVANSVTGEVVWENTVNMVNKSYSSTPGYVEVGISPYEMNLQNNTQYTATFSAHTSYNGRQSEEQVQEFTFYVDYETPIIYQADNVSSVRFEYDVQDPSIRRAYLDLNLYDNHYVQSVQLFTFAEAENDVDWATDDMTGTIDWLTDYSIPVDSTRGALNRVTIEITDWIDSLFSVEGQDGKFIGVRIDDYALNSAVYYIPVEFPEVSNVDIQYSYQGDNGQTVTNSLAGGTLYMDAGSDLDFTDDTDLGSVILASGERVDRVEFEINLFNYSVYSCAHTLSHGATCGFVYDEHVGLTYSEGDYYYDVASGSVLQKTADDTSPTYKAGTLFTDIIASYNGTEYVSNHFVCPDCGTEVEFTYNRREDEITPDNFNKITNDPMYEEVIWQSSDEDVVRIYNGRLYAVSEGEATISIYAPDSAQYPYPLDSTNPYGTFEFTVVVEGTATTPVLQSLTVGSYDNLTTGTSRSVTDGYISVDNGTQLVLYPKLNPWYIDSVSSINWYSTNEDVVEIIEQSNTQATVICKEPGTVNISLQSGMSTGTFTITVGEQFTLTSTYFYEYNGPGYTETYTDPQTQEERNMLVIPANLGITNLGYVLATREGPFFENTDIDTIVVPEGVTSIGLSTFENSSLRRIYLPSSLISLSYNAFAGCEYLEEVYWYDASEDSTSGIVYDADNNTYNWDAFFAAASPEVTSQSLVIGSDAFRDCVRLHTIDLGGVTALYDFAFANCTSLTGVVDLTDLRFSGSGVFYGCSNITGVELAANTVLAAYMFSGTGISEITYYGTYVDDAVFANMPELTSVEFVNVSGNYSSLNTIGARAFENCPKLESVEFGRSFTSLGDYAFANCTSLEFIELPAGITSIGNYAFQGCSSLGEIMLSSSCLLDFIGADVFYGCNVLAKITLDDTAGSANYSVVTSGENGEYSMLTDKQFNAVLVPPAYPAEEGQTITIGEGMSYIGTQAFANNLSLAGKTIIIADTVKEIGDYAFAGTGIVKVIIPASVETLGNDIFAYCEDVESVVFMGDISAIPEGMFRGCTALSQIELPDSVTSIGDYAFEGTAIKNITIGRNVASIGSYAFSGNESLSVLTFAANSNLQSIENSAFAGTSISQVSLPDSLVSLGQRAFEGCELLTSVYVSASLEEMGDYAFANCASLTSVTFGDGAQVVGNYAFANVVNGEVVNSNYLAEVELPSTIQSIGNYAFAGNTVIENIDISGVESVGNYAFYGTTALTTVTVDESLSYVGISAFEDSAVSYIDLSGIEYFDARSFYGTAVSDGDLTDAIEIGNSAFYDCTNLRTLRLPNVVQIYASAFYVPSTDENGNTHTGSIRSVDLGDKLVGLGGGAFFNSLISTISLPATLEVIGTPAFAGCSSLMEIVVDEANPVFFVDYTQGGLYKNLANGTYELVSVPNGIVLDGVGENMTPYEILEGTSRVGDYAMAYCDEIHAVEIPASVESIGAYAFYYMGMRLVADSGITGTVDREYYPKYIFNGLTAPALETAYGDDDVTSIIDLYYNFSYPVGYLVNDMTIPVNATGFNTVLFDFFFYSVNYSEERIESGTQALLDWLIALDVDSLTLDDAATVNQMNTDYRMMSDGQKAFVSEYVDKLTAAVERINELSGATDPEEPVDPEDPDDPQTPTDPEEPQTPSDEGSSGCGAMGIAGGSGGGFGGLAVVCLLVAVIWVVRHRRARS